MVHRLCNNIQVSQILEKQQLASPVKVVYQCFRYIGMNLGRNRGTVITINCTSFTLLAFSRSVTGTRGRTGVVGLTVRHKFD